MLTIVTHHGDEYNWHVGRATPLLKTKDVAFVQADGDELDYIIGRFLNIPYSTARVQKWRDPWAVFIVDNLR